MSRYSVAPGTLQETSAGLHRQAVGIEGVSAALSRALLDLGAGTGGARAAEEGRRAARLWGVGTSDVVRQAEALARLLGEAGERYGQVQQQAASRFAVRR